MTLADRAAMVGIAARELIDLAEADERIVHPATLAGGGIERLRAWAAAGRPGAEIGRLSFVGDESIRRAVVAVVHATPTPVSWNLIETVAIVGVGIDAVGWAADRCPRPPAPTFDRPRLVALASVDAAVIAHELAHCWNDAPLPLPSPSMATEGSRVKAAHAAVVAAGDVDLHAKALARLERLADAAASVWLGRPVRVGDDHVRNQRRRVVALAEGTL